MCPVDANIADLLLRATAGKLTESDTQTLISDPELADLCQASLKRSDCLPAFFKIHGKPYSLEQFPQFKVLYDGLYVPDVIYLCGRQIAKSMAINDLYKVRCADGSEMTKEKLVVGTQVLCIDAHLHWTARRIIQVWKAYTKPLYRVRTRMGASFEISEEHRLRTLYGYTQLKDLQVGSRIAVIRSGGEFGNLDMPAGRIALTAYMLGDGGMTQAQWRFSTGSDVVAYDLMAYCTPSDIHARKRRNWDIAFHKSSPLYDWLTSDGLAGHHSYEKFIPSWVYQLSREDTRLFLTKLWATDGEVNSTDGSPSICYTSTNRRLAHGVRALLWKFGIHSTVTQKEAWCNGKRCRDAYKLRVETRASQALFLRTFNVPGKLAPDYTIKPENNNRDTIPKEINDTLRKLLTPVSYNRLGVSLRDAGLRIKAKYPLSRRKLDEYIAYARDVGLRDQSEYTLLCNLRDSDVVWDKIVEITPTGEQACFDIAVDGEENFVLDGVISHNSTNLSRFEVFNCMQIPHYQVLYVAPLQSQTHRYSSLYLKEAISTCKWARHLQAMESQDEDIGTIMKSVGHQSFNNGAGIQLTYAKTSADRARGIFCDEIDCDELQDHLIDNLAIIMQSLTQSQWGLRRYTGTAKTVDNTIEFYWQQSAQSEWVMKCQHCNYWNIPNIEGEVVKMIQANGPSCVRCGRLLDVSKGEWVAKCPTLCSSFAGYHIPQIVVPAIVNNPKKWAELIGKVSRYPLASIYQEILGISSSLGARLISQEDIDKHACLPPIETLAQRLNEYPVIVGGLDWGIAEQTSFTVYTILGVSRGGQLHVLWAKRYMGFDTDTLLKDIAQTHRYYKCQILAADFGMGFPQNTMLANRFGIPVIQIQYARQNQLLSHRPILGFSRWVVDKVTALEMLYWAIRYGRVWFPPKYESDVYTKDLLSPYEEVDSQGGIEVRRFVRNPNLPDDFTHALCFAMLAALKLAGSSLLDVVPQGAMGADAYTVEKPVKDKIDPMELLRVM